MSILLFLKQAFKNIKACNRIKQLYSRMISLILDGNGSFRNKMLLALHAIHASLVREWFKIKTVGNKT